MNQGYVKMFRKFKDWEWYTNINVKTLFLHCLIRANHSDRKYQGISIKRGEFMTSIKTLSIESGLSERQVRTALDKLVLTNELTSKSNNKYRIIKVLKYEDYQTVDKLDNKQVTNKRQTIDKPLTTNKVLKNVKNVKKELKTYRKFAHLSLTIKEFDKLVEDGYDKVVIDRTLDDIENYKKNTSYKSLNLTLRKWLRKNEVSQPKEQVRYEL